MKKILIFLFLVLTFNNSCLLSQTDWLSNLRNKFTELKENLGLEKKAQPGQMSTMDRFKQLLMLETTLNNIPVGSYKIVIKNHNDAINQDEILILKTLNKQILFKQIA